MSVLTQLTKGLLEKMDIPVARVLETLKRVFTKNLSAVAVKGSVIRGDFIPYFSDLDIHVFVNETGLTSGQAPRPEAAMALQEVIGELDLEAFQLSSIQLTFNNADRRPKTWSASPPEVSRVVYGSLPPYDMNSDNWQDDALSVLEELEREMTYELKSVPDKNNDGLARIVRRQGVFLKGGAYSLAGLIMKDIKRAQLLPYWELDDYLVNQTNGRVDLRPFHEHARDWKAVRNNPPQLRQMFVVGTTQLHELAAFEPQSVAGSVS